MSTIAPRPLTPRGGNDRVYTPHYLARQIIDHFNPRGLRLEPCRGTGAFSRLMPGCDTCEIDDGVDFFECVLRYDWIVTNPPWSQFRRFLQHSMKIADNVVFLAPVNAFFMKARFRDIRTAGFGFVEIWTVDTPPKPWPQAGFQLAAVHLQRGYRDLVRIG